MSPNGMVETKKVVGYTDKPELTDTSKKLVRLFNWCQSEDVSISKAVKELRKLFDDINESKERRIFFSNLVFMLQVNNRFISKHLRNLHWKMLSGFLLIVAFSKLRQRLMRVFNSVLSINSIKQVCVKLTLENEKQIFTIITIFIIQANT
jgi:hypothetical protein